MKNKGTNRSVFFFPGIQFLVHVFVLADLLNVKVDDRAFMTKQSRYVMRFSWRYFATLITRPRDAQWNLQKEHLFNAFINVDV